MEYIKRNFSEPDVEFTDLDFLNEEGMMYDISQAEAIAGKFAEEKVDGIFIINCNFGCEEVAGKVAQLINKPVLIWAPRDNIIEADGTRYTDSQCGLFDVSRQLQRYGVPFSHIENCNIDDEVFRKGFRDFLSVTCMVRNFRTLRIAQVGSRPKPFKSVMINESELMEKFGIEVVPVNMAVVIQKMDRIMSEKAGEIEKGVAGIKGMVDVRDITDATLEDDGIYPKYKEASDKAIEIIYQTITGQISMSEFDSQVRDFVTKYQDVKDAYNAELKKYVQ